MCKRLLSIAFVWVLVNCVLTIHFSLAGKKDTDMPFAGSEAKTQSKESDDRKEGILTKIKNALFG